MGRNEGYVCVVYMFCSAHGRRHRANGIRLCARPVQPGSKFRRTRCVASRDEGNETYFATSAPPRSRHTFQITMESTKTRPRLETDRLILRVPSLDDLDRWAEMMADENAARFIGGWMAM